MHVYYPCHVSTLVPMRIPSTSQMIFPDHTANYTTPSLQTREKAQAHYDDFFTFPLAGK
jgi:hypothetical protein